MRTRYNFYHSESRSWKLLLMTVLSLVIGFHQSDAQTVTTAAGDVTWYFSGTSSISEVTLNRNGTNHGDGYDGAVYHTVSVQSGTITNSATYHYSSTYGMGFKKIVINNTGTTAGSYNLNINGNLGSDGSTRWHYVDADGPTYYSVSSDNSSPTTNGSDPVISFLYGNDKLDQLGTSRTLPYTNNSDNAQFTVFGVSIPANSTQIFLVLAGVGDIDDITYNRPDQALLAVQLLMDEDNWPADFTSFLTPAEKGKVINWNLISGNFTELVSNTCPGDSSAVLSVQVSGGDAPYSFAWSTGDTTYSGNAISGLSLLGHIDEHSYYRSSSQFPTFDSASSFAAQNFGYLVSINSATENAWLIANGAQNGDNLGGTDTEVEGTFVWDSGEPFTYTNWASGEPNNGGGGQDYIQIYSDGTWDDISYNGATGARQIIEMPGKSTISGLTSGTYTVTITDGNGAVAVATYQVGPDSIEITPSIVNSVCNGSNTGSFTTSVTGGTGAYSYLWNTGETVASLLSASGGVYSLTVTDANGCFASISDTIDEPISIVASSLVDANVSCNGGLDGGATASANGGTPSYVYSWSNGEISSSIFGVASATYSVTITDANGCSDSSSVTITQPTAIVIPTLTSVSITCNGLSNGTLTAVPSGGVSPYTYAWSNTSTNATATATGLAVGTFTVTVTDANGCTQTKSKAMTQPTAVSASISSQVNVSCNGGSTGSATATSTGGTGTKTYAWSNAATGATATGLAAGTYTVTATDANGCTATATVTITQPTAVSASISAQTNVFCNAGANGSATATSTGGTGTKTYAWSNAATGATATGLAAGSYTVTATDANGCTSTASVTITEPVSASTTISSQTNITCNGSSNGSATVSSTGGAGSFTYAWSNGATTASITGLPAGNYGVTATDANGCTTTASATITEPSTLVASISSQTNVLCNGGATGSATATVAGGTSPYTYAWSASAGSASTATGLAAGTYGLTVTDANGCTSTSSATITEPTALMAMVTIDSNVSCNGLSNGGATATATGGTAPYSYAWNNSTGSLSATTAAIAGVSVGTYTVIITDANGCTSTANDSVSEPMALMAMITVDSNVSCNSGADAGLTIMVSGGLSPYTYNWSNAATTVSITGVAAGIYTAMITDANNCMVSATDTTTEPTALSIGLTMDASVACFGASDGAASAVVAGGTMPYVYTWSNGDITLSTMGLAAGTYSIVATDSNGCMIMDSIMIAGPASAMTVVVNETSGIVCDGDATGALEATANGGWGVYSFEWNTTATTASISGLTEGSYSVNVTDSLGCLETASESIVHQFELPVVNLGADTTICNDASIELNAGNDGANYAWSTADSTQTIVVSDSGSYSVVVTDVNGCAGSDEIIISLDDCTGINELGTELSLLVYPNPSRGEFQIESNGFNLNESTITIIDLVGNLVATIRPQGAVRETITLNQSSGVYFLSIEVDGNVAQQRIIIQ
jgi:hypothetical protein